MYDVTVVGAGLFGVTCARELKRNGLSVLIVEQESSPGGNCKDIIMNNILVQLHGVHIFNTNNETIYKYVNSFTKFRFYQQHDIAVHKGNYYSFPINLKTLHEVFGVRTLIEAQDYFANLPKKYPEDDMETYAINHLGKTLYKMFVKDYSIKHWGRYPKELPANIIKRIPVRMTFDDRYHDTLYSGLPINGYSHLIESILPDKIDIDYGCNFNNAREHYCKNSKVIIYSGSPDELYDYDLGTLQYRTLDFKHDILPGSFQGTSVMRFNDNSVKYTRRVEHKYLAEKVNPAETVVSYETPREWNGEKDIRYYPIPTQNNLDLARAYADRAVKDGYFLGGRLGSYRYMNMDQVIAQAWHITREVGEYLKEIK